MEMISQDFVTFFVSSALRMGFEFVVWRLGYKKIMKFVSWIIQSEFEDWLRIILGIESSWRWRMCMRCHVLCLGDFESNYNSCFSYYWLNWILIWFTRIYWSQFIKLIEITIRSSSLFLHRRFDTEMIRPNQVQYTLNWHISSILPNLRLFWEELLIQSTRQLDSFSKNSAETSFNSFQ
jgi:hypothetical protein